MEYFDVGYTRVLPWARRPGAAALVAALSAPDRPFDAIVVGEAERAFYDQQYAAMAPLFAQHGVRIWVPDAGGPVDPEVGTLEELMALLGILSKREIVRARIRTVTAMTALTELQGRYLGGRPPYGYRLVPAGPHPNPTHARWGRKLLTLAPDPTTAADVKWMFAQRLNETSYAGIARQLHGQGIPPPAAADPERNRHRDGNAWTVTSVAAILTNPRYTGYQIWGRTRTDRELLDPANTGLGHRDRVRRNRPDEWTISATPCHTPLVSVADFIATQNVRARSTTTAAHDYQLAGLLVCGQCGRRMESCQNNGHPAYRCRHGHTSATARTADAPRFAYIREDHIIEHLPALLIRLQMTDLEHPRRPMTEPAPTVDEAITFLRHDAIRLTYDPTTRT